MIYSAIKSDWPNARPARGRHAKNPLRPHNVNGFAIPLFRFPIDFLLPGGGLSPVKHHQPARLFPHLIPGELLQTLRNGFFAVVQLDLDGVFVGAVAYAQAHPVPVGVLPQDVAPGVADAL